MQVLAILLLVNAAFPAFAFEAGEYSSEPRHLPSHEICEDCIVPSVLTKPPLLRPPVRQMITGKWSADLSCSVGSGRYIYTFRQLEDGYVLGTSRGVSFGVKDVTGFLISGRITERRFEFLEQVSDRHSGSFSGVVDAETGVFSGEYMSSRSGRTCRFAMKKMRVQPSGDRM